MKPARPVVTRSPHRQVGLLSSGSPDAALIDHESHLESAFVQIVRVLDGVRHIQAQPFRLENLPAELNRQSYVPDYLVEQQDGEKCVVEVKPARFVEKDRALFEWTAKTLSRSGLMFFVVTDKHITKARLETAALIRRCRKIHLAPGLIERALASATPSITWKEALQSDIPPYVWRGLIGQHLLFTDTFDFETTADARLYSTKQESEHDHQVRLFHWLGCSPW